MTDDLTLPLRSYVWNRLEALLAIEERTRTMWSRGKLRKNETCVQCGQSIQKGEHAYRPVAETRSVGRWERGCARCVEASASGPDGSAPKGA